MLNVMFKNNNKTPRGIVVSKEHNTIPFKVVDTNSAAFSTNLENQEKAWIQWNKIQFLSQL